jgi:tripartite-type tricarboxylate transporter receptor subunit TctC
MKLHYSRRSILSAVACLGASLALPWSALAQAFPEKGKAIRAILPSSPGSATDGIARAYGQAMSDILGTSVVIDNRPGAEGIIGVMAVKTAPADGHTMLFTSLSAQVVNPHVFKQLSYDPLKDFIPLAGTMKNTLMLAVGPSVPFKSAREFLAAAKANPGKYTYGSVSTITRLAGQMVMKASGVQLLNVPYKNIGDLAANWLGGSVDAMVADITTFKQLIEKGVRPLAIAGPSRLPGLPNVPTFEEEGVQGLDVVGWFGAYVTAGTPAPVVAKLRDTLRQAAHSKAVKDYLNNFGAESFELAGDEFAAFQRAEFDKWGKAVRDAGMAGTL